MALRIRVDDGKLADFCRQHHIRTLAFFGSVLRDDFWPDSDVDVLVEFEPGHIPGLAFFSMEEELSQLLGRKADLNTAGFLLSLAYKSYNAQAHSCQVPGGFFRSWQCHYILRASISPCFLDDVLQEAEVRYAQA
jgi:hypothetical protein